jgi:PKD repeat protein
MENLRVSPQIAGTKGMRKKRKICDLGLLVWIMLVVLVFASPSFSLEAIIAIDEPDYYTQNQSYFPDYGMSQTKGYASFPVFFQGWQSTDREDIETYEWDFGPGTETDHGGRYFEGLNAYHIFETPGIYTVRLRVKNLAGEWSEPATVDIEVLSREGGTRFYVDSEIGDDSYDGKSMTVNGSSGPWKSATKAFQMMQRQTQFGAVETWNYKPGDRILFKRGQVFLMGESLFIGHGWGTQGYSFESYGDPSDPKPLIQYDGPSESHMLRFGNGTGYINFIDLAFNFLGSEFQSDGLIFAYSSFKNLLLFRCDFREPDNGVLTISGGQEGSGILPGIFMVDNTIANPVTAPISGVQLYGTGIHGLVLADNTFDESGNHIAYLCYIDKALISNNTFSRSAFGRTALRITGSDFDHPSNNIHIKDNSFLGWRDPYTGGSGRAGGAHNGGGERYNWLLVQLGPNQPNDNLKMLKDIIFERNIITNAELLMEVVNGEDIIIRHNRFVSPDNARGMGLRISRPDENWVSRPSRNIHILDNDFIKLTNENLTYNSDADVPFLYIYNY